MKNMFTAYITKYALTMGILECQVEVCTEVNPEMVKVADDRNFSEYYHGEGREWHRTKGAAIAKAVDMRVKKLASLRKRIHRLEQMDFTTVRAT